MYANYAETPEQEQVLQKLEEMFYTTPQWQLHQLCVENNWNLELCVSQWMNFVNNANLREKNKTEADPNPATNHPNKETLQICERYQRIGENIKKGYKVLILMRGPPGVGKTYTAHEIVKTFVDLQSPFDHIEDFIFSADDYFYNSKGVYRYNVKYLSEAHEFNQNRVREKAMSGFSPIIVDNTNLKLWEMMPYVKYAVQNGYTIEIVEPKPSWSKCAGKLAQRNIHGVAAEKIRTMMDKYEKGDVPDLMKMLKNTKYTVSLPQMRVIPPIAFESSTEVAEKNDVIDNMPTTHTDTSGWDGDADTSSWSTYDTNAPKTQRKKFRSCTSPPKQTETIQSGSLEPRDLLQTPPEKTTLYAPSPVKSASARDVYSLLEKKLSNVWKPYEAESIDFWGTDQPKLKPLTTLETEKKTNKGNEEKSLIDLLRDDEVMTNEKKNKKNNDSKSELVYNVSFERHSVECPNENVLFVTLRQIYPNKEIGGLWDLFVKCNGDIDWAVDILLKEDELTRLRGDTESDENIHCSDTFTCSCNVAPPMDVDKMEYKFSEFTTLKDSQHAISSNRQEPNDIKLQNRSQRSRFVRPHQIFDPSLLEVKEDIENRFVLGDDHYSEHLLKIRNFRSTLASGAATSSGSIPFYSGGNEELQNTMAINDGDEDVDDNDEDDDIGDCDNISDEMLEMSLGEHLVQQLLENFRNESSFEERIPSSLPLNLKVFMPRSLAKQLYMLWMESAYNHFEEERQKMVREDEEFARLLKHPKYAEYKQSPSNLREMLNIECAWNLYKREKEESDQKRMDIEKLSQPTDLAAHLTQMKLCETFPDIPRETLLDILTTTDNNYNETVAILNSTIADNTLQEDDGVEQGNTGAIFNRYQHSRHSTCDSNENNNDETSWSPENAKRLALKEFEEARNLAAHHCQLRAECYQKAKEAIQAGNGGAGIYYSQIANLHKQKIDMYNHRAANCIINVHKYTQSNPDHLDLHYLHLAEAMGCLDLFLDRHITSLRMASRNYKYVFIITGRGKHSAGGISIIKSKVKGRLEERCLKWNEVNPGLLKVKVFSSSRHSQNF